MDSKASTRDTYAVLRTSIPFTQSDRAIAQANVTFAESEISVIDEEKVEVVKTQHTAKLQTQLSQFKEMERSLLSPIRRLSIELMQQIFLLAHYDTSHLFPYNPKAFPRVAGQVCSYWRATVYSYAPLWTRIHFSTFPGGVKRDYSRYGKLVEDCLKRSKGMPLSLWLDNSIGLEILGDACVRVLGQNAHRWRNVYIEGKDLTCALPFAIPQDTMLENFKSLSLDSLYDVTVSIPVALNLSKVFQRCYCCEDHNVRVTIRSAPSLRHLILNGMHHPSAATTGLDWSLIHKFETSNIIFELLELNLILERMPHLRALKLDWTTATMTKITLPCLESLSLECLEEVDTFDVLTTPCLKKLYVGDNVNEGLDLTESLV